MSLRLKVGDEEVRAADLHAVADFRRIGTPARRAQRFEIERGAAGGTIDRDVFDRGILLGGKLRRLGVVAELLDGRIAIDFRGVPTRDRELRWFRHECGDLHLLIVVADDEAFSQASVPLGLSNVFLLLQFFEGLRHDGAIVQWIAGGDVSRYTLALPWPESVLRTSALFAVPGADRPPGFIAVGDVFIALDAIGRLPEVAPERIAADLQVSAANAVTAYYEDDRRDVAERSQRATAAIETWRARNSQL